MRLAEPGARGDVRLDLLEGEAAAPVPGRRLGVLYMIACNCNKAECDKYQFEKGKMLFRDTPFKLHQCKRNNAHV